jgi:hypothetical protein
MTEGLVFDAARSDSEGSLSTSRGRETLADIARTLDGGEETEEEIEEDSSDKDDADAPEGGAPGGGGGNVFARSETSPPQLAARLSCKSACECEPISRRERLNV